jgi:hypothetical protein
MSSSRPNPVHISTEVRMSGRRKCGIRDALRVQPKSAFLRIVLPSGQRTRDDLGLVPVAPALQVLVGVVGARGLAALEIRVVEHLLGVGGRPAGHDHVAVGLVFRGHDSPSSNPNSENFVHGRRKVEEGEKGVRTIVGNVVWSSRTYRVCSN